MSDTIPDTIADDLEFSCPRCGGEVTARFYGPCPSCRDDLRARLGGEARDVEVEAYVPKMNVTPNAVALKD
jgi:hypothetical protein